MSTFQQILAQQWSYLQMIQAYCSDDLAAASLNLQNNFIEFQNWLNKWRIKVSKEKFNVYYNYLVFLSFS